MDPVTNPFAPGAGSPPPELVGRDGLRGTVRGGMGRARARRRRKREEAEQAGIQMMRCVAPENRSLPAILAPQLRQALLRLSRIEQAKDRAVRALLALGGCATLKVRFRDLEVGLDFDPEPGLAD